MMRRIVAPALAFALVVASNASAQPVNDYTGGYTYQRMQRESTARDRARFPVPPDPARIVYTIPPSDTDPSLTHYLRDNYVIEYPKIATHDAQIFLFLVGTDGVPDDSLRILDVAAKQGYRAIGLTYDSMPATAQACDNDPDPTCSQRFRAKRVFGMNVTDDITDTPNEAVLHRFSALLSYLRQHYPADGWGRFISSTGQIDWSQIAVSGHSQGAGIAAFIAKRYDVARVVLFSSPWDWYRSPSSGNHVPAPWLSWKSATPVNRWYGMYHAKEPSREDIEAAFQALQVPDADVRIATLEPRKQGAYHTSVSGDSTTPLLPDGTPAYLSDWQFLLGESP